MSENISCPKEHSIKSEDTPEYGRIFRLMCGTEIYASRTFLLAYIADGAHDDWINYHTLLHNYQYVENELKRLKSDNPVYYVVHGRFGPGGPDRYKTEAEAIIAFDEIIKDPWVQVAHVDKVEVILAHPKRANG